MYPTFFELPSFMGGHAIPSYGVLLAIGSVCCALTFGFLVRRAGFDGRLAFEIIIETIIVALLAAKIGGILFQPPNEVTIMAILTYTGGVWYVGFLSGVAYITIRGRKLGMRPLQMLDRGACAIAIGHGFGRLGCFFAGCCFGGNCSLPWAVTYTSPDLRTGVPTGVPLHPVQLYEATSEFLIAAFLVYGLSRWFKVAGQAGLLYLILNTVFRIFYESLREDANRGTFLGVSTSQAIAIAILSLSIPGMILLARRARLTGDDGNAKPPPRDDTQNEAKKKKAR